MGSKHKPGHRTGAKPKYGKPTEMLAVRVPADLHDALKTTAARHGKPKSEMAVDILTAALDPADEVTQSAFE
ncbi:hypothetical protein LB543_05120 [Mesorhizobium sp. ESP7-2]|uniref:hypothetical protein n=1 Tax=Mesorhizobium sp. ESP7-2 TaxID=2876622 RepID=UPI001CCBC6E2|nr:hypothetical protein [Mesorhizobium sp. ESP7-2]MBZ9706100.1 hypothetical protein [Mesorhizobium sp. ESP7-2]